MKKVFLLIILASFFLKGNAKSFYPEKIASKIIRSVTDSKDISIVETIKTTSSAVKAEPVLIYKVKNNESQKEFYAVFTQATGRYDLFDYVVIANSNFAIKRVKVVRYRSEYGGEIASKKWLSQFENFSGGTLEYKKDISALSGASFSAPSMVKDIPLVIDILKKSVQ